MILPQKHRKRKEEVIPMLQMMFGEGIDFRCTEYYQSNETLIGITLKLPGCANVPVVCLSDMPDDISAADAANTAAAIFQKALCNFKALPALPEMTMSESGLYTLTTKIRVNRAALILLPDILEQVGGKAGMDYFLIPSSIHELLVARDDGLVLCSDTMIFAVNCGF